MKKHLFAALLLVLTSVCALAQIKVENVFFEMRGGVSLTRPNLYADYYNLHVKGPAGLTFRLHLVKP